MLKRKSNPEPRYYSIKLDARAKQPIHGAAQMHQVERKDVVLAAMLAFVRLDATAQRELVREARTPELEPAA